MKKRITALLLCCVMLLTLCPGLISTATAYDDTQPDQAEATGETVQPTVNFTNVAPFLPPVSGGVRMQRAASFAAANFAANDAANFAATDNGMKISKTATPNADGSYTITLEAYATGSKVITEQKTDIPTDIILVLDQSGSMADDIGTVTYKKYEDVEDYWETTYHTRNQDYYECRHNGGDANLWHKLSDDSYVSVSVTKREKIDYNPITNGKNNPGRWDNEYTNLWDNRDILYALVGGEYVKVSVDQVGRYTYTYTYTLPGGTVIASGGSWDEEPAISGTDDNKLYLASVDSTQTVYTYTYTDKDGNDQTIGTSTGATTVFSPTLYERVTSTSGGGSRLNALKIAATNFANQVATKANGTDGIVGTDDDVKHRIAVVGYAGSSSNLTNGFKQMNNTSQAADVSSAIDNLTANGGTHIDQGLSTANGIFASNPIGDTENRNRVVIVFTDGAPGSYGDWCSESVQTANDAIAYAKKAKNPTSEGGYGATVYTIGIFSGADASNPDSLPAYTSYTTEWGFEQSPSEADQVKNSNRFMHLVSSNYPAASSITQPGSINPNLNGKSYYLSAADSVALNNIFQQISEQIESGGSSTTLDANAEIRDVVSNAFTMPENTTDINLYTAESNGSTDSWKSRVSFNGTTLINESKRTISVSGFSFKDNWCGNEETNGQTTFHDGKKLIIEFTVKPENGFLGGNNVYTNAGAGVYENSDATQPVLSFPQPQVNVPIQDVTVTAKDKNVYLKGEVTADQLKDGSEISVGDVKLDLSKATDTDKPYGLAPWQTEYVDITITVKDKDGNVISDKLDNLTDDTTYTVEVTVAPKTEGTSTPEKGDAATAKTGTSKKNIYAFKPELTFKDSTAYYGESVPANNDYSSNYVANSEKWKNGGKYSTDDGVQMIGTKPTLDITYTPDGSKLEGGKYTKQDLPVKATVNIGTDDVTSYTTFLHETCTVDGCKWNNEITSGNPAFLIHIKTCTLTITKRGCNITMDENQSFIFDVTGGAIAQNMKVTVQGNGTATIVGLPVGTYTVTENQGWSWRYEAQNNGVATADLNTNHAAAVTITNTRTNPYWLSGDNYAVNHEGGIKPRGTFSGAI